MSIMDFFSSQGTAEPMPGSERGDWIDWFLNREGLAGRFKGSRRPRYGIDYLFNDGGSVRSKPRSSPGPKTRQKLQPRTPDVLGNVSDRYYRAGNVEGMKRIGQEMQDRIQNHRSLQPGTGYLFPNVQEPWNNPGPGSYWNASLQSGDNSGIMAAMTDTSPDFRGNWLFNNKFGNMFGNFMLGRHGDKISPKYKEILGEAFGQDGGISAFGGKLRPIIGDDGYGFNWKIGLGG